MKRKSYVKNLYRIIFKTKARFFSIFIIIFLGAAFYAGLRHTPSIMRTSINNYLNQNNFQDIELISTFGYDAKDIQAIEDLDYVEKVDAGYRFDALVMTEDALGVTVFTTDDFKSVNKADIVEGSLPTSSNEVLMDRRMWENTGFKTGQTIKIQSDYKIKEYTIVGIVNDSRYICDTERGVNSLGNGSNVGYLLMLNDGNEDIAVDDAIFDLRDSQEVYTELRIILKNTSEYSKFDDEYEDYVENYKEELETLIQNRHDQVYKDVIDDANKEIDDATKKYNDGVKEYEDGLKQYQDGVKEYEDGLKQYQDGVKEYEDGLKEYQDGLNEYNKNLKSFNQQINDAKQQLDDGYNQLSENEKLINENKVKVDQGIEESNQGLKTLSASLNINSSSNLDLTEYTQLVYSLNDEELTAKYNALLYQLSLSNQASTQLIEDINTLKNQIDSITIKHNDTTSANQLSQAIKQIDVVDESCDAIINYDSSALQNAMVDYVTYLNTHYYGQEVLTLFQPIQQGIANSNVEDINNLKQNLPVIKASLEQIQSGLNDIQKFDEGYNTYLSSKEQLDQAQEELNKSQSEGQKQLDAAKKQLDNAKKQLDDARKELAEAKQELDDAHKELENAKQELADAKKELAKAKTKIDNAKEDINDIEKADIISLTTQENAGVISFDSNCDAMNSISLIFPLIFFLVAALVSLTTMTRMVEEHRVQSGTLRALGYSKKDVIMQYMIYAFLATFFACGLGIVFGTYFFSYIIYWLYTMMMYDVGAKIHFLFQPIVIIQTYVISVAVTMLVTFFVCYNSLKEAPASLLRPKAPKLGKRILLERINIIWKKLSFNQKVTMRNIFRYKKRFFMSVIGIAGCTALIITGFGVKYSVSSLADKQYHEVWLYNSEVGYDEDLSYDEAIKIENKLREYKDLKNITSIYSKTIEAKKDGQSYSPYIQVPSSLKEYSNLADLKENDETISLRDDGVYIDLKLSELLDVKTGDTITLTLNDRDYDVKVNGVFTLYFYHYVIMSESYYTSLTGDDVKYNSAQLLLNNENADYQKEFKEFGSNIEHVSNISYTEGAADTFTAMMSSLNSVVIILIVCAGMLAFVVLYNLTNINIQERKSEIATIKVLGFYPKEVYDYVFRENIFLSVIGAILGMFFGYALHGYLIRVVEIDMAHFVHSAGIMSYLYSFVITMLFTYFIDYYMRRVLNKIDMVESLKSIE